MYPKRPLSYSTITKFMVSPETYRAYYMYPKEQKNAFDLGNAFECALLFPEKYEKEFYEETEKKDGRTKKVQQEREEKRNEGFTVISYDDSIHLNRALKRARNTQKVKHILARGTFNERLFYTDKQTGLKMTVQVDSRVDLEAVYDIKTTSKVLTPLKAIKTVYENGYDIQGVINKEATGVHSFYNLFFQLKPPYEMVWVKHSEESLSFARSRLSVALREFKEWYEAGYPPVDFNDISEYGEYIANPPKWML